MGQKVLADISSVPISVILRTVWNDMGEVFVRLRGQFIIGLSIVVFLEIVASAAVISNNPMFLETFGLLNRIAVLPFEIAIFRLLILDEPTAGYHFAFATPRFQRVLGWSVALWALGTIPPYLPGAITSSEAAKAGMYIAMFVIGIVVMARVVIFLPAIAVDAPGASLGNAFADTSGHAWFVVKAYLAILLPLFLIGVLVPVLMWLGGASDVIIRSGRVTVAANLFFVALGFLMLTAGTIVAARLFMRIGDRVKGVAAPGASE
jgi:hypothetical protein